MSSVESKVRNINSKSTQELRFNYAKSAKTSAYHFLIDKVDGTALDKDHAEIDTANFPVSEFYSAIDDFFTQVTSAANTYAFLGMMNREFAQNKISQSMIPYVSSRGEEVTPNSDYEKAFKIKPEVLSELQADMRDIIQSVKTREALGPMILLNLTAHYDVLISSLIKIYLSKFPGLMDKSEKTFTLSELKKLDSIQEAEIQLIDREVDSVMYGSHLDQITWFESKLKKDIQPLLRDIPRFCEIFERRNLCAHTNQMVSKKYIDNCKKLGIPADKVSDLGSKIVVDHDYIDDSVRRIVEHGIVIGQFIWRSLCRSNKAEIESADRLLLEHCYRISGSDENELAERILSLGYQKFFPYNDLSKREMVIARAEIFLNLNNPDQAKIVIEEHDWSSSNNRMKMLVHAIRGADNEVLKLMELVKADSDFDKSNYASSAVFKNLRENEKFREEFQRLYEGSLKSMDGSWLIVSDQPGRKDLQQRPHSNQTTTSNAAPEDSASEDTAPSPTRKIRRSIRSIRTS